MNTINIVENFKTTITRSNKEFNIDELLKILTEIYYEIYNYVDDDIPRKIGRPKKIKDINQKRKPSEYNLFISNKYQEIKKENPTKNTTEIMKIIAELWNEQKKYI